MIKDIVTNLSLRNSRDVAMDFAVSTAAAFDAHLAGIAFKLNEPIIPAMVDMYGMPPEVIESQRVENENMAKAALGRFEDAARGAALSAEPRMVDAQVATAPGRFADIARRFDLSVLGQPEPDQPTLDRLMIEAALFDTGRPMLVVPYIQRTGLKLDHIMLAWDGSRSAARAAGDALPFIRRGKLVEIVIVASDGAKSDEMPGADIAQHLARHGAKVELNRIVTAETDVANTILSARRGQLENISWSWAATAIRGCVSSYSEVLTREILTSMTIPTLMSH